MFQDYSKFQKSQTSAQIVTLSNRVINSRSKCNQVMQNITKLNFKPRVISTHVNAQNSKDDTISNSFLLNPSSYRQNNYQSFEQLLISPRTKTNRDEKTFTTNFRMNRTLSKIQVQNSFNNPIDFSDGGICIGDTSPINKKQQQNFEEEQQKKIQLLQKQNKELYQENEKLKVQLLNQKKKSNTNKLSMQLQQLEEALQNAGSTCLVSQNEANKLCNTLSKLLRIFEEHCQTEIHMNQYKKEVAQKLRENNLINLKQSQIKITYEQLESDYTKMKQILFGEEQRRKKAENDYKQLKEKYESLVERNSVLEKRVEILSLKNLEYSKDQLLRVQGDIVKENEVLNKNLSELKIESTRLKDMYSKAVQKIDILYKKIEFIKKNKKGTRSKFFRQETLIASEQTIHAILQENRIPDSLCFRYTVSGNPKFINVLNEISFSQPEFVQFIQDMDEQKKDIFVNLGKQFLTDQRFINILTEMLAKWAIISSNVSIEDFQIKVSQVFKEIFLAENILIWVYNENQEEMITLNSQGEELKMSITNKYCLSHQCLKNKKNIISLQSQKENAINTSLFMGQLRGREPGQLVDYHTNQAILCPLVIYKNQPFGILEVSNIYADNFDLDMQLCVIIFSQLIQSKMISLGKYMIKNNQYITTAIKIFIYSSKRFKHYYWELYKELLKCESENTFQQNLLEYSKNKLNIEKLKIFFFEQNNYEQFYNYDLCGSKQVFNLKNTTLEEIVENKKCKILFNPYNHEYFNNQIDIETSLPVLYAPLFFNEQQQDKSSQRLSGVIQIVLKQNYTQKMGNFARIFILDESQKLDKETIDQEALHLAQIISQAYQNVHFFIEKQQGQKKQIIQVELDHP